MDQHKKWFCDTGYTRFVVELKGVKFQLSAGEIEDWLGLYDTPEEAVIAVAKRSTQNDAWNLYLADKDVPTKFSDWEIDENSEKEEH